MRRFLRNSACLPFAVALLGSAAATAAQAIEFQSLTEAAILYDRPTLEARRLFILKRGTPVEIIVNEGQWLKVREPAGAISWIESRVLSKARTVLVSVDRAVVRQAPDDEAAPSFEAARNVVLDLIGAAELGWIKVRHPDGLEGYLRTNQAWGL